ncbi:MAG TPA: GH116 family glycosyl hydrolase [Candidatus Latescibacteria bacterium]|nr:GH116 family glycosyl hydrolase [Candidatus Latescibacterota bacterium]
MSGNTLPEALAGRPDRRVILGKALRAVAMPLGGIGAGQIALAGDGGWRQWQIMNIPNHLGHVPHSFFAVRMRPHAVHFTERRSPEDVMGVSRVLMSSALYDSPDFIPPVTSSDHIVPEESRTLLRQLPGVDEVRYVGEYPVAEVIFSDPSLPLPVTLEAYSPFAPLDEEFSGLPAILCDLVVTNTLESPVHVSLAGTLQNAVGWDGKSRISGTRNPGYGGNENRVVRARGLTCIEMTNPSVPAESNRFGQMALSLLGGNVTWLGRWDTLEAFWADFADDGDLSCTDDAAPTSPGSTANGALCRSAWLKPGETLKATFVISWFFPNHYVNWDQSGFGLKDRKSRFHIGTHYATRFQSALDVAMYVSDHAEVLRKRTFDFRNSFYDSSLPYSVLDAVSSQASIIRSPTCMWLEDGTFHAFEGCHGASTGSAEDVGGCCPLNCSHVWNYEQALARLFPRLEQAMRRTDLLHQMTEEGRIGHRTLLPLYLPRWTEPATDGQLGTVLKLYREYRACGDRAFLDELYPKAKKALEWVFTKHDVDGKGILDGFQPNTYDCALHGHNTFVTGLYLAALRAAEEMAKLLGDSSFGEECRARFESGKVAIDAECWNGEYYIQRPEPGKSMDMQYGEGCHIDQLFGQWWAHILDLGYVFPSDHVREALRSILRYNWRDSFSGFRQSPRVFASDHDSGLLICTWPHGGRPDKPTLYSDEVWPGTEYEIAGLCLFEGFAEEAFKVVEGLRKRYDGVQRNPWNEVECGDHYARSMASWTVLEAACGMRYDAGRSFLGFGPNVTPERFRAPFVTASGWGVFSQRITDQMATAEVIVSHGTIPLACFELDMPSKAVVVGKVLVNGKPVRCTCSTLDRRAHIAFGSLLELREGNTLTADVKTA